jgi:hypothetical protein
VNFAALSAVPPLKRSLRHWLALGRTLREIETLSLLGYDHTGLEDVMIDEALNVLIDGVTATPSHSPGSRDGHEILFTVDRLGHTCCPKRVSICKRMVNHCDLSA